MAQKLRMGTLRQAVNAGLKKEGYSASSIKTVRNKLGIKKQGAGFRSSKKITLGGKSVLTSRTKTIRKFLGKSGLTLNQRRAILNSFKGSKINKKSDPAVSKFGQQDDDPGSNRADLREEQRIREQANSLKEDLGGKVGFTGDGPPISQNDLY